MTRCSRLTSLLALLLSSLGNSVLAPPAFAQMDARVKTALEDVDTGGAIFDADRMKATASAFQAPPPPQTDVTSITIEDDTTLKLLSDGDDVDAYDAIQTRPQLVIDPNDSRLDPAKWAGTTGVTTMGDLESGALRSCTYSDFGSAPLFERTCDRFRDFTTPSCSVLLDVSGATDVQDATACEAYETEPLCQPSALTCISGAQTRVINGIEETRLCWEWQQDFFCHAATDQFTNCVPYEDNPACAETGSTCLATASDGDCSHESVSFECGDPGVRPPQECAAIEVCQGSVCDGIPVTPDTSFAEATAWLNIADQTVRDNNLLGVSCATDEIAIGGNCPSTDIRFFEGTRRKCTSNGFLRNCCNGSGIATSLLGGCDTDEVIIQQGIQAGTVHHVGEYCSSSFFGLCLSRQRSFCDFNSKIARVFQEQSRAQVGLGWLGPKTETCRGFSQEEMASINFDAIDLSELFGDMLGGANVTDPNAVETRLKTRLSGYFSSKSGDLVSVSADPNFDEANVEATPDPISGTVSYAHEDAGGTPALTYAGETSNPPVGAGTVTLPSNPDLGVGAIIPPTIEQGVASPQTPITPPAQGG